MTRNILFKILPKKALLLAFITIITFTSKLLPMNMHMEKIDLKINQKPQNLSVYDWSKQKAAELVREKRLAILRLLDRTEEGWEETKENLEPRYKRSVDKNVLKNYKQILPKSTHDLIMSIIGHPLVQKELGITGISIKNGIIIAERAYSYPIKFLSSDPNEKIGSPEFSDGYNIIISPIDAFNDRHSDEELEAIIGHELGHIKCKHILEEHCFRNLYLEKLATHKTHVSKSIFDSAISEWHIAIEVQADIVGIFNNWIWLETMENYWRESALIGIEVGEHPPLGVRANYCHQMYSAIKRESEPKARPIINPANNKPVNIKPAKKPEPAKTDTVKKDSKKQEKVNNANAEKLETQKQSQDINNNQEWQIQIPEFIKNFVTNLTTKQALTICGIVFAAYIVLK